MNHCKAQEDFLYQQVADRIEKRIQKGAFKTGDKLLSVRMLSKDPTLALDSVQFRYVYLFLPIRSRQDFVRYGDNLLHYDKTLGSRQTNALLPMIVKITPLNRIIYNIFLQCGNCGFTAFHIIAT